MPQTPVSPGIDPMTLARFMVLPGAVELLDAFALIPPGRLRETAILHVQALAEAHQNAPPQHRAPDPLDGLHGAPERPKALPRRTDAEPKTDDPKTRAVKMRLDGKLPYEIAEAVGLSLHQVYQATSDARAAGIKFPPTPRAKQGASDAYLGKVKFAVSVEDVESNSALAGAMRAAEARQISIEDYFRRRKAALEMALAGQHIQTIVEATRESKTVLSQWFNLARTAGHPVPYMFDAMITQFEDAPKPPSKVIDLKSRRQRQPRRAAFITSDADASPKVLALIQRTAEAMGLTREQYYELRSRALTLRAGGKSAPEIATLLNITPRQAANWARRAAKAGVFRQQA